MDTKVLSVLKNISEAAGYLAVSALSLLCSVLIKDFGIDISDAIGTGATMGLAVFSSIGYVLMVIFLCKFISIILKIVELMLQKTVRE